MRYQAAPLPDTVSLSFHPRSAQFYPFVHVSIAASARSPTCVDGTKIRVAGINAREIEWDGARMEDAGCNEGAPCPSLDAVVARDKLVALLGHATGRGPYGRIYVAGPRLACATNGTSYDRIAAWCVSPATGDISCDMVKSGAAAQWDHFWRDHRCA
jgi:hypothetical protein